MLARVIGKKCQLWQLTAKLLLNVDRLYDICIASLRCFVTVQFGGSESLVTALVFDRARYKVMATLASFNHLKLDDRCSESKGFFGTVSGSCLSY